MPTLLFFLCLLFPLAAAAQTPGTFTVTAKWTNPVNDTVPIIGTRVERSANDGPWESACIGSGPTATSCDDTAQPLTDSNGDAITYRWRAIRFTSFRDSDPSSEVVLNTAKPGSPTNLQVTVKGVNLSLDFKISPKE